MSDEDNQMQPFQSLKDLNKQRGTIKGRLTLFSKYLHKYDGVILSTPQKAEMHLRMQASTNLFKDFNTIQSEIEQDLEDDELGVQLEYRETFEELYYSSMATAKCLINESDNESSKCNSQSMNSFHSTIKLPDIKLPVFDGSYDLWLEFRNSYITIIH